MRVALCQIPVSSKPAVNLERVRSAVMTAADGGADLAVFPEATHVRFGSDLRASAEPLDGEFCTELAAAAAAARVSLVAGVFEPAPGGRVYNTAVAYDADGGLVASYRKLHLFDALGQRESDLVAPGSAVVLADLAGTRVGLEICYDIRFPELSRALAVGGASLLVVSAAWAAGTFKEEHWVTMLRARAIENTVWVAAAGQVPDQDEPPTKAPTGIGRSMLIDPMGVVRADLGPSAGITVAEADIAMTGPVRSVLPSLENRREDVFGPAVAGLSGRGVIAVHLERPEALRNGHELDPVDVHVRRQRRRPVHRLGDVRRPQWLHARVDGVRLALVAAEPHRGELGLAHAGLDGGDAHARAVQVAAQVEAELVHEGLGGAVDVPSRIRVGAGDRAEVDHVATSAGDHARQDRPGAVDQAAAVRVDHLLPFIQVSLLGRLEAQGKSSVVDQQVDLGELRGQRGDRLADRGPVPYVETDGKNAGAGFLGEISEPVRSAGRGDDARAVGCETTCDRGSEATARAGDEYGLRMRGLDVHGCTVTALARRRGTGPV